jgi:hypothetical protein
MVGISDKEIAARLVIHDVSLVRKSDSSLMRIIAFLMMWNKSFMRDFWVTIVTPWSATIYYPSAYPTMGRALQERGILWHELEHVEQARAQGNFFGPILFAIAYLLLPFPVYFAYCRAHYECEAYASTRARLIPQDADSDKKWAEWVATVLWTSYARTLPIEKCSAIALQHLAAKRNLVGAK